MAALFHVWVNPFSGGVLADPSWLALGHVALAAVALAVVWCPSSRLWLAALAALGLVTFWQEAPVVGNHWLLSAFVNVGLLATIVTDKGGTNFACRFVPVGKATLVAFYVCAAFAKLNHGFLDRRVSCGVFYSNELANALHLGWAGPSGAFAAAVPWVVIAIELAIPVLLIVRRTRVAGVALGLAYHSVIALNTAHLFSDFSSVMAALFLLCLPSSFGWETLGYVREKRRLFDQGRIALTVVSVAVLASLWVGRGELTRWVFLNGRVWMWFAIDAVIVLLVARWLLRGETAETPTDRLPRLTWLAAIPALVVVNGLTPYLEIKTSYGWNMYSNLETVAGDSNHLLVPATLPVTDIQRDLVRIVASDDPGLALYAGERYDLPFLQLRAYLSEHPSVSLAYERKGQTLVASPAGSDPDLVAPLAAWERRIFAFRAVDQTSPSRCQPAFFPAH